MDVGAQQRVVAVGASAGGVEALIRLAAGLPRDLGYAVMVVLHMGAEAPPSQLARILDRSGPLPAVWAAHGDPIETGRIHVAVPNRHLLVSDGRIVLSDGPIEHGHRPAINPLFCSVALAYGERAVGVLMSGVLDDGVQGLAAIRARGGIGIIQTPRDARFPVLPLNALRAGVVDHQVVASGVGGLLRHLASKRL
jgi:two-component system, chemotaxis family, protein-glutamate methylesterase/glutaminase